MRHFKKGMAIALSLSMILGASGTPASAATAKVQSVSISKPGTSKLVLKKKAKYQLKTKVTVKGKISKKVTYKSSNTKVVTVSTKGKLTAKKNGKATITVTSAANKSKKAKLTVQVGAPVTKVKLSASKLEGKVGESATLNVTFSPKNPTVKKVKFTSSNAKVAKVSSKGKVSFLAEGTANITAKAQDGSDKKATCKVTVTKADDVDTEPVAPEGYSLKWHDEFDGDKLNRDDWNVELHERGWVNAELQEYVDSADNIYLKDGKLEIKPIQTKNEDGTYSYTSGRITTQKKHDYTYGYFEARAKVPTGKGYLPAFWLMATDESESSGYGQWPRCGEIDIMEIMGDNTNEVHNTIHYGKPDNQNQGNYKLSEGTFADDYHTFAAEWMPGEIIWYVDGKETYRTSDWHSTTEGVGTVTYPAPFDQPFYVILNLAVGGNWVGYPDDATFQSQNYSVDYVRVYQKDSYDDSNVKKPSQDVDLRDPDENGNYINNGDFAVEEDLTSAEKEKDWEFLTTLGGEAEAKIENNAINISTTNAGTVDYSVQLVHWGLPLEKGASYKVSFDAYADDARRMNTKITGPNNNYAVYSDESGSNKAEEIELTTDKKSYEYNFRMLSNNDANGRLEFNMGNYGSTAGIHISNVKVEKTGYEPIEEDDSKTVLKDGNYVYNSKFQEGDNHLGFWEFSGNDGAEISVTDFADGRKLKVVAPEGTSKDKPVVISQSELALTDGEYALSFDAKGEKGKTIDVNVAGVEKSVELTEELKSYNDVLDLKDIKTKDIVFTITAPGTYYLDNVRIEENALIQNGSFDSGLVGYEVYVETSSADAEGSVDSVTEGNDNAADIKISNTGDEDWKVQLKQVNVKLEQGQCYRLSLDVRSTMARRFKFALQRDGLTHKNDDGSEDWYVYAEDTVDLTEDWQTFSVEFEMTEPTDLETILSLSMGAFDGVQITDLHHVYIDNIKLDKIDELTQKPEVPEIPVGENMLKNADFAAGEDSWIKSISDGGVANVSFADNKATLDISDVGTEDWSVQLKQEGIALEKDHEYTLKFKATTTAARTIKLAMMSTDGKYTWYDGKDVALEVGKDNDVEFTFTMTYDTDTAAALFLSMGLIKDVETPASTITLSDLSLVKVK